MHFKITTRWLFIILINNVLLTCGLRKDDKLMELPATLEQMKDLASSVCFDMFLDSEAAARCLKNFQSHHYETNKEPPTVEIKCQSENKVTFAVPQSKDWQLVVMILNEDDNSDYLFYNLMEPAKEIDSIYTPSENFTFWTALLNDVGSTSLWKKGPVIEPWKSTDYLERKTYVVETAFLFEKYDNETEEIDAEISWNATDPTDSCFDVFNRCNKNALGNVLNKKIRPDQNRSIVAKVPLNDKCTVIVKGKYGTTEFIYNTPSCYDLPGCKSAPEMVKDLTLEAEENSDSNWIVRARWKPPQHPPSYYIVTLTADAVYTANVSGASTEVVFNDVQGEGLYNVTVVANNAYGHAVSTRRNIFPILEESASMSLFVGAWAAVLVLTTTFAIVFVWWKRQRDIKKRNMYFPGIREKPLKDDEIEVTSVESGAEDQWEVKPERLLLHEVIGEGAFGVVRRGNLAPDNKDVAVKMLKDFPSMEEIRSFRAEMDLMKSVGSHPHVVSLVGCFKGRKPYIVAEYCSRGDLLSYLRCSWDLMVTRRNAKFDNNNEELDYCEDLKCKRDSRLVINRLYDLQGVCDAELTFLDLLSFCRQIAMGMEFLASNRVVHRDLAARNILVSADKTLKIADFGLSRDIYQENQYKQKGNGKMPVKWMAIESLTHRIYTTQSDVWSFGVVMWEIVTVGGAPYPAVGAARLPRLLRAGYRMPRPPNCSTQLYELMVSCWHERPRSRPTFGELHLALDALLCASAHHYLDLQLPPDACEPRPLTRPHARPHPRRAPQRYVRMIIRGEWPWSNRGYQSSYTPHTRYKLADSLQTPLK